MAAAFGRRCLAGGCVLLASSSRAPPLRRAFADMTPLDARTRSYAESLYDEYAKAMEPAQTPLKDHESKAFSQRFAYVAKVAQLYDDYSQALSSLAELDAMTADSADAQLLELAKSDRRVFVEHLFSLSDRIRAAILPPTPDQNISSFTMELECGVGGVEAMLFTNEMLNLYRAYALFCQWDFCVKDCDLAPDVTQGALALRRATVEVAGEGAYEAMRFESGVHRVQRVPITESASGRMHTSTMSVALIVEAPDEDVQLKRGDLKVEYTAAHGPGGQNVNKSLSHVRLVHRPTGVVIACQDERTQLQNEKIAMARLRAALRRRQFELNRAERERDHKLQVGSRDRAEKVRTYNFAQDRVTDHRIKRSFGYLQGVMMGREHFHELIQALGVFHHRERLERVFEAHEQILAKQPKRPRTVASDF